MASTVIDRATGVALISAIKAPCVAATTANITLYGEQTIDGVAVVSGDRVLVKNQTAAAENGVYVVDTGGWDRAPDFDSSRDIQQYVRVYVGAGSENANSEWALATASPIPDTSGLSFMRVNPDHRANLPEILGTVGLAPSLDYTSTVLAAIASIKSRALGEPLVINGGVRFDADITIDVPLVFAPGAYFTVTAGHTVTIANSIDAPRQHILRGDGLYVLGHVGTTGEGARQVHVSWFGVFPYAGTNPVDQGPLIQAIAMAVGNARESVIEFDIGNYTIQSEVTPTRCCWIRGQGARRTVFRTTTDGFSLFKTSNVGAKITDCQFESWSPLTTRNSPYIEIAHGECEVYDVALFNADKGIVVSGNNSRVRNVTGAWGSACGSGSALVSVIGGTGHRIADISGPTSSDYGPEQLVLVGGAAQTGTISGVTVRDVYGISPSRSVAVVAQSGSISRVDISDIQSNAYSGSAPDSAVLLKTAGSYGLADVSLSGFEIDGYPTAGIRIEQGSSGTTEDISIDNGNVSGSTGNGIELVRTAGTLKQVRVSSTVDLSERATPIYKSGTMTEIVIDPGAIPGTLGSVCYDLGDIADDTAVSIDLGRSVFTGTVEVALGYTYWGDFVFRAAPSPGATKKAGHANVVSLASALTGTTGTDGNATLGVQASTLYVENRLGSSQRVQLILKTGIR